VPTQSIKLSHVEGFGGSFFTIGVISPAKKPNPEFVLNFPPRLHGASFLLGGRAPTSMGLQREHAPWGVKDYGFRSSSRQATPIIFYNNCFKNGILPATILSENNSKTLQSARKKKKATRFTVNLAEHKQPSVTNMA